MNPMKTSEKILHDKLIKETIVFNGHSLQDDYFNITYASDKKFIYGVGVSVTSVIINNPNMKIHFHIFLDEVDDANRDLFKKLISGTKNKITIYIMDSAVFRDLPVPSKTWSAAIYFRLLAIEYLSKSVNFLLYIDSDVICHNSISSLEELTFSNDVLIYAVHDHSRKMDSGLGIDMNKYFNSGLMYMDIKALTKNNIPDDVIRLANKNNYTYPDQDALNVLLNQHVINLEEKYNNLFSIDGYIGKGHIDKIVDDVVFIHYVGPTKPFHNWSAYYSECQIFEKYRKLSPWANIPLLDADSYKQLSRKKTHQRKNKKYILFLITYIRYVIRKFSS